MEPQYNSAEDLIGKKFDQAQAQWVIEQLHEMLEGAQWVVSDRLVIKQLRYRFEEQQKLAQRHVDQMAAQHAKEMRMLGY